MIYNVVLNTVNRSNQNVTDSITNSEFFFDWNILPIGQYKVSFTFISTSIDQTSISSIPVVYCNLGQTNNYITDSLKTSALSTNIIGILQPYTVSSNSYLYADSIVNHPILMNRPTNNNFRIDILRDSSRDIWYDNKGLSPKSYILTLSFEQV